jgi:hypothetical protein
MLGSSNAKYKRKADEKASCDLDIEIIIIFEKKKFYRVNEKIHLKSNNAKGIIKNIIEPEPQLVD